MSGRSPLFANRWIDEAEISASTICLFEGLLNQMKFSIDAVLESLRTSLTDFFSGLKTTVEDAEKFFTNKISDAVTTLMTAYYEQLDAQLLADKKARRKAGLVVERRSCARELLTSLGMIRFKRTYYKQTADGECGYTFPIDAVAGIEHYQRLSCDVSQRLVDVAQEMSYARSSKVVTGGSVSGRTVGNKVRQSAAVTPVTVRKSIPVLHVDADEDHVTLQRGRNTIVPLVSVYEGTDRQGKRGVCRNCWHKASYGQKPDDFWEETLNEIERRYDLANTKIYLHGDGAAWIKKGLEWLPNSVFVLDRFHKNKAIKKAVSGIEYSVGKKYAKVFYEALRDGDKDLFEQATQSLLDQYPEREKTITQNTAYLLDNYDAIRISETDPEAIRGGSTEPHVSHVLSARLSSRPMAWSKKTLEKFVPILAAGQSRIVPKHETQVMEIVKKQIKKLDGKPKHTTGLTDPRLAYAMPGRTGQVTPLFNALRRF